MKVLVAVDKNGGIMFNNRRVSQDSVLRTKIMEICGDSPLYMSEYSAKQFKDYPDRIKIDNKFPSNCKPEDFCFLEDILISSKDIDELYLFNWNRNYPSDFKFEFNPLEYGMKKVKTTDFKGSSHDKITLTVYRKK